MVNREYFWPATVEAQHALHLLAEKCEAAVGGHVGSALTLYVEDMYRIYKDAVDRSGDK